MTAIKTATITCAALILAGYTCAAAANEGRWTLGLSGGTLGVGPELAYRFNAKFGLRGNAGVFSYDHDDELDEIDYEGELDLNSFGALFDWYPMGGGFRISAGARVNNNKIKLRGQPTTFVEIGNTQYSPAQVGVITGTVAGDNIAPTLTLGYGGSFAKGFTVGFELGVMLQGSPTIEDLRTTGLLATNQTFLTNLQIEKASMESDAKDFKLWPVLQLHLLYRF